MIQHANEALINAYAPYSNYKVASCLCTEDDHLFVGVNVENASYGLTVCAETAAICQMIAAGKKTIKSLVLLNDSNDFCSPCGACRQRIFEFSTPETVIYFCNSKEIIKSVHVGELLPYAFSFKQDKK
ncbi:cytidine deaminase [Legionella jordanis]|nr:cytidine deaminase [Legionella jordanis]RMX18779.1 cytidine deaminase [Legionella jordanis]HAT8713128.1 cytidine deaminase [Legionella jordanis]